jgi:hypothetical protein
MIGWKGQEGTNALAYLGFVISDEEKECFTTLAPGCHGRLLNEMGQERWIL